MTSRERIDSDELASAIAAARKKAAVWNVCDPPTNIPAEAAKQIALAAIDAIRDIE